WKADAGREGGGSDAARAELDAMVRSAVGFQQARGDLLTLSVLPFAVADTGTEELPWWENSQVHALAKLAIAGLIALLLLLIVVRPAVRSLTQRNAPEPSAAQVPAAATAAGAARLEAQARAAW